MANTQQQAGAVSLRPSTFAQGGSLLDDVDVTFTRLRFGYGYGESKGNADSDSAVTLHVTMQDSEGNEHMGYYSVGNGFVPSEVGDEEENGKQLVPVGEKTAPSNGSNFALWLTSFINAGLPEDLLDSGDVSVIEGAKAHVNRVPAPKRNNLPKRPGTDDSRVPTILLVSSVIALPGEEAPAAKGKAGAGKPAAKGPVAVASKPNGAAKPAASTKAAAADTELTDELASELVGLFAVKEVEAMKKVDLVKGLFASIDKTNPNKQKLLQLVAKDEVLNSLEGFAFDGKSLNMAG